MDFCHLIVTCLFSMLRLPFDNQKVKGNYAIFFQKIKEFLAKTLVFFLTPRSFLRGVIVLKNELNVLISNALGACFYLVGKWCWVCKVVIWSKC